MSQNTERQPTRHRILLICLAIFISFSPGISQLGLVDSEFIRAWRMYGSVGLGAPFGEFSIVDDNEKVIVRVQLKEAMALDRLRDIQRYPGSGGLITGFNPIEAVMSAAQSLCPQDSTSSRLQFTGRVAEPTEWVTIDLEHDQLCQAAKP